MTPGNHPERRPVVLRDRVTAPAVPADSTDSTGTAGRVERFGHRRGHGRDER